MMHYLKVSACFLATACATAALAQSESAQPDASTSPVAYVYLSGVSQTLGFATSASGKLAKIPGSPFAIGLDNAVVTKKYFYAASNDGEHIYGYAIAGNGSLKLSSTTNALKYHPDTCGDIGVLQSDAAGTTIYNQYDVSLCDIPNEIQAFKVEEKGDLQYEGRSESGIPVETGTLPLSFATGDKYVYQTSCGNQPGGALGSLTEVFQRETDGFLKADGYADVAPRDKAGYIYCSELDATDKAGHLVDGFLEYEENAEGVTGPFVLASYTVSREGKLSTENTRAELAKVDVGYPIQLSIAPSGKFLAILGSGFQVFHFNGSKPITHFSNVMLPGPDAFQLAWDGANHLYVLYYGKSGNKLYGYTVTESSIHEAAGSPYSVGKMSSLNVLPLK